jgi:3-oxoacyl-[acyl-carrier-protein] synthase II
MKRVVITGMDLVTALGGDVSTVWRRLLAGENGIDTISCFDASQYACRVAAELRGELGSESPDIPGMPPKALRRTARAFLKVARGAWKDAGLSAESVSPERTGVAAGTSVNYINMAMMRGYCRARNRAGSAFDLSRFAHECHPALLFHRRVGEMTASAAATALGVGGPTFATDTACAASSHAIGEAFRCIQRGRATLMVAGGAAALVSPVGLLAFSVLGALSRNPDPAEASRPFDRDRDGFVMGEGAGAVVLEERDHALARGAPIYAEVRGYGSTISGHNLTDPSPGGECEERAMRLALREGGLQPEQIAYVAAHGTSTAKNDAVETRAIRSLFGSHASRLLVSSNKAQLGHTLSAAGVCNVICATRAIAEGCVPPTAHYRTPDPECDLDYVPNVYRRANVEAALANAFAFGGQNAVLALAAA